MSSSEGQRPGTGASNWIERLGLDKFTDWTIFKRIAFVTVVGTTGAAVITLSLTLTYFLSAGTETLAREVIRQAITVSIGFLIFNSLVVAAAFWGEKKKAAYEYPLLVITVSVATFEILYYLYLAGLFSGAILILAGGIAICRASFGRGMGYLTLGLAATAIIIASFLYMQGILPYGPIFRSNMGEIFRDPVALWSTSAMCFVVLVIVHAAQDFVSRRMERAIEDLERTNRELAITQADLAGARPLADLGGLVSQMAKELNNPLSISLSMTESAIKDLGEQYSGGITREGVSELFNELSASFESQQRVSRIINQFTELTRYAAQTAYEPVDLNVAVRESLQELANPVAEAGDLVTLKLAKDLPQARGHSALIQHVLAHLESNALWAISDDSGRSGAPSVEVETLYDGRWVVVRCRDNGPGMSSEVLKTCRTPFFTTRRARGGVGLGLYIADQIAKWAGGSLNISSVPGEGTLVELKLPAWDS